MLRVIAGLSAFTKILSNLNGSQIFGRRGAQDSAFVLFYVCEGSRNVCIIQSSTVHQTDTNAVLDMHLVDIMIHSPSERARTPST